MRLIGLKRHTGIVDCANDKTHTVLLFKYKQWYLQTRVILLALILANLYLHRQRRARFPREKSMSYSFQGAFASCKSDLEARKGESTCAR